MPKTRVQKAESIDELVAAFKEGKAAFFVDYQGMPVDKVTALRKKLVAVQAKYLVAKKTLLERAAKAAGFDIPFRSMPGMLGVAFANQDEVAPAKIVGDAGKTAPLKLVGGLYEGKVIDQIFAQALSKLPGRKELLGQLLSVFNGPMSALARLLNARREKLETNV